MDLFVQTKEGIFFIDGYKLKNGLACHHSLSSQDPTWAVVDITSGLLVKNNFKSLKECQLYAMNCPELEKIEKARKSIRYKSYVDKIAEYKKNELENNE